MAGGSATRQLGNKSKSGTELTPNSPPKKQRSQANDTTMSQSNMPDDVAGSSAETVGRTTRSVPNSGADGSNSAGGIRGTVPMPSGARRQPMVTTREYVKQYKLRIHNEAVDIRKDVTGDTTHGVIRYPYHDIPVNMLGLYLSKSEIVELHNYTECRVLNVECHVAHKTAQLVFETNATTTNIGNNNVGVYMVVLDPLIVNTRVGSLPRQSTLVTDTFWGKHMSQLQMTEGFDTGIVSELGAEYITRNFSNKFEYHMPLVTPALLDVNLLPAVQHFPNVNSFVNSRTNASMVEGELASYSYAPHHGIVAGHYWNGSTFGVRDNDDSQFMHMKNGHPLGFNFSQSGSVGLFSYPHEDYGQNAASTPMQEETQYYMPYKTPHVDYGSTMVIDDPFFISNTNAKKQPALVVGIEPLLSTIDSNSAPKVVKCHVDLYVTVKLTMRITQGVDYLHPSATSPYWPKYMHPQMKLTRQIKVSGGGSHIYQLSPDVDHRPAIAKNNQAVITNISNNVSQSGIHGTTSAARNKRVAAIQKCAKRRSIRIEKYKNEQLVKGYKEDDNDKVDGEPFILTLDEEMVETPKEVYKLFGGDVSKQDEKKKKFFMKR